MKTNEELQKDVADALLWEPFLNGSVIHTTAKDGIVTLTGSVDSYAKKAEAEEAAKNVSGVKAVVEKLSIVFPPGNAKTDAEIALEIDNAFKWHWDIPNTKISAVVQNGLVTLVGELEWNYQKEAAHTAVSKLIGVRGISNDIKIVTLSKDRIEKKDIQEAIERNGHIDKVNIDIDVCNNVVTLKGSVDSWYQKSEAGRIAWNAPGVLQVHNDLFVDFNE